MFSNEANSLEYITGNIQFLYFYIYLYTMKDALSNTLNLKQQSLHSILTEENLDYIWLTWILWGIIKGVRKSLAAQAFKITA